jgi:hypothetical protein
MGRHLHKVAGRSAAWLARLLWEQEVASSNLATPTTGHRAQGRGHIGTGFQPVLFLCPQGTVGRHCWPALLAGTVGRHCWPALLAGTVGRLQRQPQARLTWEKNRFASERRRAGTLVTVTRIPMLSPWLSTNSLAKRVLLPHQLNFAPDIAVSNVGADWSVSLGKVAKCSCFGWPTINRKVRQTTGESRRYFR